MVRLRALRVPWRLMVLAIFVAGLILPIWWLVARPVGHLPGLGAYPSAYLGDTILLPVGCLILVIGIRNLLPAQHEYVGAAVGATVAAAAAIAVQAAWLRDPHPRLNWTLPRAEHFNAAGWWHAIYFTAMSAVVFTLAIVFLLRVRHNRRSDQGSVSKVSDSPGAVILLATFGSYIALVVHDNFSTSTTSASASSLALTGAAVLLAVLLITFTYGRLVVRLIRPALIAVGIIDTITTFAAIKLHSRTLLTAESAAAVCVIAAIAIECHLVSVARYGARRARTWKILGIGATVCVLVSSWIQLATPLAQHDLGSVAVVTAGSLLILIGVLFSLLQWEARAVLPVTLVGLLVMGVAAAAAWYQAVPARLVSANGVAVTIVTILVGAVIGISSYVIKARTDGVLGVPVDVNRPGRRLQSGMAPRASAALALIALFAVGGFLATFTFVVVVNRNLRFPSRTAFAPGDMRILITGAVVFAVSAAVFAVKVQWPTNQIVQIYASTMRVAVSLALGALLIDDMVGGQFSTLQVIEGIGVGVITFLWTFNSVLNNIWLMQGRRMSLGTITSSLSLALLSGATGAWVLTVGIMSRANARTPWQAATIALAALIITGGLVVLLGGSDGVGLPHYTELPVWRGLLQDALSCSAIILILIFPVVYLWSITTFGVGLVAALPIIAVFAIPFIWIMKANREHPSVEAYRLIKPRSKAKALLADMEGRSLQRFAGDQLILFDALKEPCRPKSEDFIRILAAHTRNQNRLAGIMIMVPVAGTLQILLGLAADSPRFAQHLTQAVWPSSIRETVPRGSHRNGATSE